MKYALAISFAALVAIGSVAYAQTSHQTHGKQASTKDTPATKGYRAANDKMHKEMNIKFSGNADVDFIRGMIPHHVGAIDMAKVVLQFGKDDQTRKWATDIIREQEREIAEMQAWLKKNGQ